MPASFQGLLARNLEFGHILEICAKAQQHAKWFNITLSNKSAGDDANTLEGLQMLVQLNENQIAFKTANHNWQEAIYKQFESALFFEQFKINITMSEDNFNVVINDKVCTSIAYNLAINILNHIKISGDLEYIKRMDHRKYFPCTWPPLHLVDEKAAFSNDQPMSFQAGHVMVIHAKLAGNNHGRLVLQIKNAHDNTREELHISARFDTKKFIRNTKTDKHKDRHTGISYTNYGVEETFGSWPFKNFSAPFMLAIGFTANEFYLAKDGKFLCRFPYRTKHVLPDLVGVKLRANDGLIVQVNRIDHFQMDDPECHGFEKYCKLDKKMFKFF